MSELQTKSMERWRNLGFLVASVERRKRFPDRSKGVCRLCKKPAMIDIPVDLFNVFDMLCIGRYIALIQVTDFSHHANRRSKILASAEAKICCASGCVVAVESWDKDEKNNRWKFKFEPVPLKDFPLDLPGKAEDLYEKQRKEKLPDYPEGAAMFDAGMAEIEF